MSHLKRFIKYLKFKKISIKEAPKKITVPNLQVTRYLTEVTKNPSTDFITGILTHFPDLSARWWLCDEGEMIRGEVIPEGMVLVDEVAFDEMNEALNENLKQTIIYQEKSIAALGEHNAILGEHNAALKRINELERKVEQLKKK